MIAPAAASSPSSTPANADPGRDLRLPAAVLLTALGSCLLTLLLLSSFSVSGAGDEPLPAANPPAAIATALERFPNLEALLYWLPRPLMLTGFFSYVAWIYRGAVHARHLGAPGGIAPANLRLFHFLPYLNLIITLIGLRTLAGAVDRQRPPSPISLSIAITTLWAIGLAGGLFSYLPHLPSAGYRLAGQATALIAAAIIVVWLTRSLREALRTAGTEANAETEAPAAPNTPVP